MLNTKLLGGTASKPAEYVEDVFSTWLYKGNDSTQTITNGIDLAGKGGLVFVKNRSNAYGGFAWYDTARGVRKYLRSNGTAAELTAQAGSELTAFNNNGFSLGTNDNADVNLSPDNYVSWTFREAPKFFDVVTYTGNGASSQNITHSLGSAPGMIIVKSTDLASQWFVYHKGLNGGITPEQYYIVLSSTGAQVANSTLWNDTAPTSTQFSVGSAAGVNNSGSTFVAYLFAHDAGGFGAAGTDNVISCGSFTTNGSGSATVSLGYEPQYVMIKSSSNTGNWFVIDNMRGFSQTQTAALQPNLSNAEIGGFGDATYAFFPTATGFQSVQDLAANQTYIYMAIRRPMKPPTSGTQVFKTTTRTGTGATATVTGVGFPPDLLINLQRDANGAFFYDRLRGNKAALRSPLTAEESTAGTGNSVQYDMDGYTLGADTYGGVNTSGATFAMTSFKRATGFFDEVCYTGTGSATTFNHNLGVIPEMMIVKERDVAGAWRTYVSSLGNTNHMVLNSNGQVNGGDMWNSTNPTSTVFSLGTSASVNRSAGTFVNYLFATCPGVSKVGSYTGNGTTQSIACGFTGGARFVMIKRTDAAGDWYTYDTARGMTTVTDPYLLMNSTAAEVATLGSVTTSTGGFSLNSTILADINISGGNYIFLAIA